VSPSTKLLRSATHARQISFHLDLTATLHVRRQSITYIRNSVQMTTECVERRQRSCVDH